MKVFGYHFKFTIDGLPKMTNAQTSNWKARHFTKKKWEQAVVVKIGRNKPDLPLKKATLKLTRCSSACPDYDGLVSGFKPIIDGLIVAGVIEDDSMDHIGMPEFKWEKAPKKCGKIIVEIKSMAVDGFEPSILF